MTEYLDQSIVIGTNRLKENKCETSDVISDVINLSDVT